MSPQCPNSPMMHDGSPHSVVGCGSDNISAPDDEGIFDCLDCGMWFHEEATATGAGAR